MIIRSEGKYKKRKNISKDIYGHKTIANEKSDIW